MKSRIFTIIKYPFIVIIIIIIMPLLLYRIPTWKSKIIEREIRFQVIDFGQLGGIRYEYEYLCGNKRLFLVSKDSEDQWVYVSPEDFDKCWAVPWTKLKADSMTFVAVLKIAPTLFGVDNTPAKLIGLKPIKKMPYVSK
jgi:hypothetical protein